MIARGVVVENEILTKHYISKIGYYRFAGYTLPFQVGGNGIDRHNCKDPVKFETILDRYIFDRKLRLFLMDAIERIEVSIRAALSNSIAQNHGPHWYLETNLFISLFDHPRMISEVKRQIGHSPAQQTKRDVFIRHYYDTYDTPDTPPSWMVFEAISFGVISKIFAGLKKSETRDICLPLKIPHDVLDSWLHNISYIRNLCAHHSRVWNRTMTIKPKIARKHQTKFHSNDKIYGAIVAMQILLEEVSPDNSWAERLKTLLEEHPQVPLANMGFSANWKDQEFWRLE